MCAPMSPTGPAGQPFLQPRRRPPCGSSRRPTGIPAAVLPRRDERPSPGPNGALREQASPLGRAFPRAAGELRPYGSPASARGRVARTLLAERYCLYVVERGRALRADVHHPPWPLQPAEATIGLNTMARPLGLELDSEPLLHYSARQDTLIGALEAA